MKRFVFLAALVLAGCGGGSDDDDGQVAAPGKCETWLATWCGRWADCWVASDPSINRTATYDECRSRARSEVDCGSAVGVSATYDRCLSDIAAMTCLSVIDPNVPQPASCKGIILVK